MNFKSSYFQRFFWLQLCLIVPVLIASMIATSVVSRSVEEKEEEKLVRQLEDASGRLAESISDYSDEAILLASQHELLRHKLTGTFIDIRKAIEFLQLKKSLDTRFTEVFIDIGGDKIYASNGLIGKELYISTLVSGREEEIRKCHEILSSEQSTVDIIGDSAEEGYLLYSFQVDKAGEDRRRINYLLSFEQLGTMLRLRDGNQFFEMETGSGRKLIFGYDDFNILKVFEQSDWEEKTSSYEYMTLEQVIPEWELTVKLYCNKDIFWLDGGLYQVQLINIVLILLGIALSAVISWCVSMQQMKKIGALEATLKGEPAEMLSEKSAFGQLQSSILIDQEHRREFERKVLEDSHKLREARVIKIFNGGISDNNELSLLFQELGLKALPKCFFVGAIATKRWLDDVALLKILPCSLTARYRYKDYEVIFFLYEIGKRDENRILRHRVADDIRIYLYEMLQEVNVYIGMSKVYTDCKLINAAYDEALYVLEKMVSGEINDFYRCWEDAVKNVSFLLPDAQGLSNFSQALLERNIEQAIKWLHYLLNSKM